ncbi:MAG TPA: LPS export ABC transporter ATP-binding protein [Gemmataceae bacterium]|nr:LPS export ABC transporter ATP-binding protein [Gemmataceae bacterium]
MALLSVKGLVKYYGRRAVVNGVEFEVNAGEVVGLLGPNGAGKTTSFRMATGQLTPNEGKVWFKGEEVNNLAMYERARLGMGYLPQEISVFRKLNAEQNIIAILEMMPKSRTLGRPLTRKERYDRMEQVIHRFGLNKVRKTVSARLSGGEKRRLEIARCLVCEPLLILMDEPFTGIDPITIAEIRQIILELRNEGIGILLTDHNVHEALKITTRSYLIKDGKVRTHGTPSQIVRDPIAINEYLGQGFSDNSYRSPDPAPVPPTAVQSAPPQQVIAQSVQPATPPAPPVPVPPLVPPPIATTLEFPAATPKVSPAQMILEQEKVQRLVEGLKTAEAAKAAEEIIKKGMAAVPALLAALERRDPELRQAALEVLQAILKRTVAFDPYAVEATRKQHLALLRDQFERKAG